MGEELGILMALGCVGVIAIGVAVIIYVVLRTPKTPARTPAASMVTLEMPEPTEESADETVEDTPVETEEDAPTDTPNA